MHVFFTEKKEILRRRKCRVLHVAPESCIVPHLQEIATQQYLSGDLIRKDVQVQLDVQTLPFSDESFEVVYCSHVLQAVDDDDKCLAEIYRVLTDNGWAMINVPCRGARGAKTREFHAGGDHQAPADFVRIYGSDFIEKMVDKGFNVVPVFVRDIVTEEDQQQMSVTAETVGAIYLVQRGESDPTN